jgi:two-component system response regulator WspF
VESGIVSERPQAAAALERLIAAHSAHRVVWSADLPGLAAQFATRHPDVLVLALPLLSIDGVALVRRIMTDDPCPILILTEGARTNIAVVFDAMGHGAFGAVEMPSVGGDGCAPFLAKLETIARLGRGRRTPRDRSNSPVPSEASLRRNLLIAIGASAGGPSAVATILKELPLTLARVVIVQHVDQEFVPGMALWLSEQSRHDVRPAVEGETPAIGRVLLAAGSRHLTLAADQTLRYTAASGQHAYTPSVDVFFDSLNRSWNGDIVGVLLTGMGKDGALGLKGLRDAGHLTIAQDEASSAVYGMPKAAAALDAAVEILPLPRIGRRLVDVASLAL